MILLIQAGDRTVSKQMTNTANHTTVTRWDDHMQCYAPTVVANHLTPATVRDIVDSALDVINDQTGIRFNKFLTKDAEKRVAEAIELALLHSKLTA